MPTRFLLVVVLVREDLLENVILALTETGAEGAIVIDGQNMQRVMAFDLPIFAGFREELTSAPGFAKIVLATVSSANYIEQFQKALAFGGTDWIADNLGRVLLLPLAAYLDSTGG
jgi:hypothetical protein